MDRCPPSFSLCHILRVLLGRIGPSERVGSYGTSRRRYVLCPDCGPGGRVSLGRSQRRGKYVTKLIELRLDLVGIRVRCKLEDGIVVFTGV